MMILTPEQIEAAAASDWGFDLYSFETLQTLLAYAEIVKTISEMHPGSFERECMFCGQHYDEWSEEEDDPPYEQHDKSCPYVAARKLRGKE